MQTRADHRPSQQRRRAKLAASATGQSPPSRHLPGPAGAPRRRQPEPSQQRRRAKPAGAPRRRQPEPAGLLRVGIVGCGFATRTRHLPGLRRVPHARTVALADSDPSVLAEVAEAWGIARRYTSARELARDPEVDAVAVCVPASAHVEVALEAVEAGKHVLVEKPLALSLDDADRLVERTGRSAVKAMVGFNLRWHRLVREAVPLVRSGAIGPIEAVRTVYSDPVLERPGLPHWRGRRAAGGGGLLEKAVHHFDLWRFLLGDEVEEVFAFGRRDRGEDQTVAVVARTRGGVVAEALVSDGTATSNEVALYGERGALHLDLYRSDGLRLVGRHDLPGAPRTRLRQLLGAARQVGANLGEIRRGGAFDATYEAEWTAFAEAIRLDRDPQPSLDDGRRSLQIVLAAAHSVSTGEPVRVADAPSTLTPVGAGAS